MTTLYLLELLLKDALERNSICSKLRDTLSKFLNGHGFLVEVEAEQSLVVEIFALLDIQARGVLSIELLGHLVL